jgi:hypothetical protein
VGQTYNSSLTAQYINRYDTMLTSAGGLDLILNVADLAVRPLPLVQAIKDVLVSSGKLHC